MNRDQERRREESCIIASWCFMGAVALLVATALAKLLYNLLTHFMGWILFVIGSL